MKAIMKLFESELDRSLAADNYLDCRGPPDRLLRELRSSSQLKKLAKSLDSNTTNPFKLLKLMSLCNVLLIYSKQYFPLIEEHLKYRPSRDQWLNSKVLQPYHKFLIKCCTSRDVYLDSRNLSIRKGEALQMLFYSVNMLKHLFKVVEKMPFLGRYYKPKNNSVVSTAVEVIALQAQKLYGSFKHSLTEILYQRELYIKNSEDECIMRGILVDQLTIINEEMKKLFLDKYFYPLGRGIGVKLFRPEEQGPECEKTIQGIVSNHEETEREQKREELEKTLFPGSGLVNWNFYEQTLLSAPLNTSIANQTTYKELDELVISQGEEEDDEPVDKSFSKNKAKEAHSDKETNTGTVQMKGSEL